MIQARRTEIKERLDAEARGVQACKASEAEAASQLRSDQTKLAELQERISRLDKTLEQLGVAAK